MYGKENECMIVAKRPTDRQTDRQTDSLSCHVKLAHAYVRILSTSSSCSLKFDYVEGTCRYVGNRTAHTIPSYYIDRATSDVFICA